MHFFNPVPVLKLVEVIRAVQTSDETAAAIVALARDLGKEPVEARDVAGFVSNRILMPFVNEAAYALMEGVADAEAIDTVAKLGFAHPMGPLALADLIGLDTCVAIMEVLHARPRRPEVRAVPAAAPATSQAGRLGRKTRPRLLRVLTPPRPRRDRRDELVGKIRGETGSKRVGTSAKGSPMGVSNVGRLDVSVDGDQRMRLLLVDDDAGLRALVRATFDDVGVEVVEAESAAAARRSIRAARPDVVVLDVVMPRESGIDLCRALKADEATAGIPVVLLSGSTDGRRRGADCGADAFLTKPFSPLQLLALVERLAVGRTSLPHVDHAPRGGDDEQLFLYARDLRRLLELERAQSRLLQNAYRETVAALADALATKDTGTRAHSQRVQRYALELIRSVDAELVDDPSIEYGFLLHDVGKIGIPDAILVKPAPLAADERRLMEEHTVLGEQMLRGVAFFHGEGLAVVRSHHERWDGSGYPDGLRATDIPVSARVFAVADALDAMTSDRPYRRAGSWAAAGREIVAGAGTQFDPAVVRAFVAAESGLRRVRRRLAAA